MPESMSDGASTCRHDRRWQELQASVQQTLLAEANRNELKIAYARTLALAVFFLNDSYTYLSPQRALGVEHVPLLLPLYTGSALLLSLAFARWLWSGSYHALLRVVVPTADAIMIISGVNSGIALLGKATFVAVGGLPTIALASTLLVVSGGLRLHMRSAIYTTALGLFVFIYFAPGMQVWSPNTAIQAGLLVGVGVVSIWMTRIVHRTVGAEVARVTLGRFLPPHLVRQAYSEAISTLLSPQIVEATVLVSDLRAFTRYAEKQSANAVLDFLNEIQGRLAVIVHSHGGTVDKFMGDGMLAVFGAPNLLPDHGGQAIRAAEAMVESLSGLLTTAGDPVRVGIGIDTGSVVSGCLGNASRLEYTVIGDPVNTASRLEALTKDYGGPILISTATIASLRSDDPIRPRVRPLGPIQVRGKADKLEVFQLGAGAA